MFLSNFSIAFFENGIFNLIFMDMQLAQPSWDLSKDGVPSYQFALPPEKIRSFFDSVAEPLFAKIESNENESRTLAQARDRLLPKLLSSEIRVGEAKEMLEGT